MAERYITWDKRGILLEGVSLPTCAVCGREIIGRPEQAFIDGKKVLVCKDCQRKMYKPGVKLKPLVKEEKPAEVSKPGPTPEPVRVPPAPEPTVERPAPIPETTGAGIVPIRRKVRALTESKHELMSDIEGLLGQILYEERQAIISELEEIQSRIRELIKKLSE